MVTAQMQLFGAGLPALEVKRTGDNEIHLWQRRQIMKGLVDNYDKSYVIGQAGEEIAVMDFAAVPGMIARHTGNKRRKCADIGLVYEPTGEFACIEIKTARKGKDGYQFILEKKDCYGSTSAKHADWLLLQCVTPAGAIVRFLLRTAAVTVSKIRIRNLDSGKYHTYRMKGACMKAVCQQIFSMGRGANNGVHG